FSIRVRRKAPLIKCRLDEEVRGESISLEEQSTRYGEKIPSADIASNFQRPKILEMVLRDRKSDVTTLTIAWDSADGKCAIEVAQTGGARGSYLDLRDAAEEMSEVCLEYKAKPEGAIASNIVNPVLKAQLVTTVDLTNTNHEKASWYDIWAATVAIAGMCVMQGKGGTASWLGTCAFAFIT
ncbi:MAG: hypothetical protein L6R42_007634, partial [Xanthoria sp. 1 TBL-2021]